MRHFTIWYKARFLNYPYWRVTYKNGSRTRPLLYAAAKGCADTFGGRLWIDYTLAKRF